MKPKNPAERSVSAAEALERAAPIKARGEPKDLLAVLLSALRECADGKHPSGLVVTTMESTLLLDHLSSLQTEIRSAHHKRGVMELRRNEAVERAGLAELELQRLKKPGGC